MLQIYYVGIDIFYQILWVAISHYKYYSNKILQLRSVCMKPVFGECDGDIY